MQKPFHGRKVCNSICSQILDGHMSALVQVIDVDQATNRNLKQNGSLYFVGVIKIL